MEWPGTAEVSTMFKLPRTHKLVPLGGILTLSGVLLVAPVASAQTGAEPDGEPSPAPLQPPAAAAPATAPTFTYKQKDRGIALFCNFTARLFMVDAGGGTTPSQEALSGGIFAGYKLGRWLIGMGLDVSSFDTFQQLQTAGTSSKVAVTNTGFLLAPGAQVAILRTADRRFELIGAAQIGLGSVVARTVHDPELPPEYQPATDESTLYLTYRLAPGLRFWPYPQLALSVLTGFGGDYLFTFQNNPSGHETNQNGSTAFFFNLGALGVF
jgi:hypothetical protein